MFIESMIFRIISPFLLFLGLCLSLQARENGEVIQAYVNQSGRKVEKLYWEEARDKYVLVSYPRHFDVDQTYHLSFWFPGTSGKPSHGIADKNDQYVEIGLSYVSPEHIPAGRDTETHWRLCESVEESVVKRTRLKVGRRIVSGVSKGGWLAVYLSVNPPAGLHGVGIIAAGRSTSAKYDKVGKAKDLAVFVGTGETDSNFPYAQLAIPYFKEYKVESLCYEEWLGAGHVSIISPRVIEWLDIQAKKGESVQALTHYCDQVASQKLSDIDRIKENKDKYVALRHLLSAPCYQYVSKSVKNKILTQGRELTKSGSFKAWLVEFNQFRAVVKRESEVYDELNVDSSMLKKLADKYQLMANQTQYSDIKTRAAYAYLRVIKLYTIQKAQEIARKNPAYQQVQQKFERLRREITDRRKPPTQEQINAYQTAGGEMMKLRNKYAMSAFYDVEWHKKYASDPAMDEIIEADDLGMKSKSFYSGVGY